MKSIGIVVPVKNQITYIAQSLTSLKTLNPNHIDVLIVDGASTDGTLEYCENFVRENQNFRLISGVDKGQSDAIRIGFEMLNTTWFGWLNGDDFLMPWTLPLLKEKIDSNQSLRLIYGKGNFSDVKGNWLRFYPTVDSSSEEFAKLMFEKLYVAQPSVFYRHDLYFGVNGVNINLDLAFDYDLWARFAQVIRPEEILFLPVELSSNREYPETKTKSQYSKLLHELIRIQRNIYGKVSPYVVQAVSDYKFSQYFKNQNRQIFLKRFVIYKFLTLKLNYTNIIYAINNAILVPLALNGSIINDRVSIFQIIKHKISQRLSVNPVQHIDNFQHISGVETSKGFDELTFTSLNELDEMDVYNFLKRIRVEDPYEFFEPHSFSLEGIQSVRNSREDFYFQVKLGNEELGYALLRGLDEGYEDLSLGIFVFPRFRGLGFSNQVMCHLEKTALSKNIRQLRLSVHQDNYRAKRFYASLGYGQKELKGEDYEIWTKTLLHSSL